MAKFSAPNDRRRGYDNSRSRNDSKPKLYFMCAHKRAKNGSPVTYGWRVNNKILMKYFAAPYGKSSVHTSENGREWLNVILKVQNMVTHESFIKPALMDVHTGKVICQELSLVMDPNKGDKGVIGTIGKRSKR